MNKVKQFMNKITDKNTAVEPSAAILQSTGDTDGLSVEGFLCPDCMTAFHSAEKLQDHHETIHAAGGANDTKSGDFDVSDDLDSAIMAHQEVVQLRYSLEDERKHSAEMHREVLTLRSQLENSRKSSLSSSKSQDALPEEDTEVRKQDDKILHLIEEMKRLAKELRERGGEIEKLNTEITRLESELEAARGKPKECSLRENELSDQCSDLRKQLTEFQLKYETVSKELEHQIQNAKESGVKHEEAVEKIKTLEGKLQSTIRNHNEDLRKLEEQLSKSIMSGEQSQGQVEDLQQELSRLQEQQKELISRIGGDQAHAAAIESLTKERDALKTNLEKAQAEIRELRSTVSQEIEKLTSDLKGAERKFEEYKATKENETTDYQKQLSEKDKRIKEGDVKAEKLNSMSKALQVELSEQRKHVEKLDNDVKNSKAKIVLMAEKEAEMTGTVMALKSEVEKSTVDFEHLNNRYNDRETANAESVTKLEQKVHSLEVNKSTLETSLSELEGTLDVVQKKNESKLQQLIEERQLLQSEYNTFKEDTQAKFTRESEETKKLRKELELDKATYQENLQKASEELKTLHEKLRDSQIKFKEAVEELKCQKDSSKAELENMKTEIKGLNDQVSTTSKHAKDCDEKVRNVTEELQKLRDETKGFRDERDGLEAEKLVFDKKYKASEEARLLLLERCLVGESETEKYQATISDLQRRLDDSLSALQELGRENQSLQVESAKLQGRKWADDATSTNCNTCSKEFSLKIRKHHCRVCGNIFCDECSSRTALIPSCKKPVRVCDACFEELSTK